MPHQLSTEELQFLKQSREVRDMLATPGWKIYKAILEAQIETRLAILTAPAHDLQPQAHSGVLDGQTRYGALEHIKGAYNGLKLALTLPQSMVDDADTLRKSSLHEGENE